SFIKDISNNKKGWVHNSLLSEIVSTNNVVSISKPRVKNTVSTVSKSVPNCDYIITSPSNGDKNVNIKPTLITWVAATGSPEGYYLSLGANENVNNINIGNVNSYAALELKPNTTYALSLVPYNSIGLASCYGLFTFTTGSGVTVPSPESSVSIIENRMRRMGLFSKWKTFNRNNISKFKVSDINKFFSTVNSFMGVQYLYGGTNRFGIDCSGLVYRGLKSVGYTGERLNAESVAKLGTFIANKKSLRKGDLVCFSINKNSKNLINHIAVYNGSGGFIHAPSSGKTVRTGDINDVYYWGDKFIFGVRLTNN
ncbi:MAG: C40 family peptidase, partial [Flavobacteriales bacterium]